MTDPEELAARWAGTQGQRLAEFQRKKPTVEERAEYVDSLLQYVSTVADRNEALYDDPVFRRVRQFLALNEDEHDESQMWVVGGIALTWGDLRHLAYYNTTGDQG